MRNLCIFLMLTCLFIEALGQNEQDTIMEITYYGNHAPRIGIYREPDQAQA